MFGISMTKWKWILAILLVANMANYIYSNWGLVTVKATDEPLGKIISSIEWQGWVKIYTNLPLDTKVTMYVDHAPLAEAMETLAANVDVPPPANDDGTPGNGDRPARPFGGPGGLAGFSTNAPGAPGGPNGGPPGGGPPGGGGGGGGRGGGGGFGRRAEWNLAFFIAPTSTAVKQEIREFQSSDPDDNNKVYNYNAQTQVLASETVTTAPDPRLQAWTGAKPVDPAAAPSPALAQASTGTAAQMSDSTTDPPAAPVPIVQTYLQAFAQSSNIWIMAPGTWTPDVSSLPPPDSSIIRAVENFVSEAHGSVEQAIVLRAGRGGARGGPPVVNDDDAWANRMLNAINGLPADQRADATDQLNQEIDFRKKMRALPPDQRRQMMIQHFAERMLYGDRSRLSPEKRAKAYSRMIQMRQAAKAQK